MRLALAAVLLLASAASGQSTPLDGLETGWSAAASDGVGATVELVPGVTGRALRLRYDFGRVSGYAYAKRALSIAFPADYVITFKVRGTGGINDLQLKFVDASGKNVWWHVRRDFRPSAEWRTLSIPARDVSFAWGPSADKRLTRTASVELVLVRGRDGGAGYLDVDDLTLTARTATTLPPPVASDPAVLDGRRDTAWSARRGGALTIDFGGVKALGGLTLHWASGLGAKRYTVSASDDGRVWRTLRTVADGDGGDDPIALPETETRRLRIALPADAPPAALAELDVEPLAWGATPNATIAALARQAPRGSYPRGFSGEQSYWTLLGREGGGPSGLLGEDGAVEVAKGGFSIEPFLLVGGRRISWAEANATQSLEDGYLPLPHVGWAGEGWQLDTLAFADATAPRLWARWRVTNTGSTPRAMRLVLAVRPFQVNPPAQFLSQQGGVRAISAIRWANERLTVTSPPAIEGDAVITRTLFPLRAPDTVATAPFDRGALATPTVLSGGPAVDDPTGLASASFFYALTLAPGESAEVPVAIPFDAKGSAQPEAGDFERAYAAAALAWRATLGEVAITVPPAKQAVADSIRTSLAHILMSRDGPALKPGTRSYDRSWIRDGAMMSDALLRLGVDRPVAAFADWYAGKLFADGKVPCCVDARGADPVPENDAQGEFIHLQVQLYRYTGDRARLARAWPTIDAARRYMDGQRRSERTPATPPYAYGLMPRSISHEGYSAEPQYSLWDDFWAHTGYKDAAFAAAALGRPEARAVAAERDAFARDLHAAITASVKHWGIDYIPGATSLGDFDATSTTMALDPAGEAHALDPALLANTFDRQWRRVLDRTRPGADWKDYTPYEWRNVSAMVRLGRRDRANGLLDIYMRDRRPLAWNGWAEVVGRDPRAVRFIGDLPHAWVASDFIRASLDLFAYSRDDGALVLGAGLDGNWLAGKGSAILGLRTPWGTLDLAMRREGGSVVAEIGGTARPPGGFVLPWPLAGRASRAAIDGEPATIAADGLHIPATGGTVRVVLAPR